VASLQEEAEGLRNTIAMLENLSEQRAHALETYAEQVASLIAGGEATVAAHERTLASLQAGMAAAGVAAAAEIAKRDEMVQELRGQLFTAEEGRLAALACIAKAEMKAESAEAEAEAGALAAQAAGMQRDIATQKLEAALDKIERISAAHAAASGSELAAHASAAKWSDVVLSVYFMLLCCLIFYLYSTLSLFFISFSLFLFRVCFEE